MTNPSNPKCELSRVCLAVALALITSSALAQSVQGSATSHELDTFRAGIQASGSPPSQLAGTSWRLVRFQGSDDTTLTPDDRTKYTIEFATSGNLNARIDCNRGRGRWTSSGSSQIQLGVLALTRAKCPPGSLHDQIVKQWPNVRSYVVKDGHLFLALMADGGIYEFEPTGKTKQQEQNR